MISLLVFALLLAPSIYATPLNGRLQKRERVPDEARKSKNVEKWMEEVGIQTEKMVFYSGTDGQADAKKFVDANPSYTYFWKIFDEEFVKDFGDVSMDDKAVTRACSLAMGGHSEGDARVFGHKNAASDSYWKLYELPLLKAGDDPIWQMKAGTTDPDDHPDGDLNAVADDNTCDVSYKFGADFFEIRGKHWPQGIDPDGEMLRDKINGCAGAAAVTKYSFKLTPDDCCFAWYASGNIIIGQKSCIGNAVIAAGGSTKGDCHGAG